MIKGDIVLLPFPYTNQTGTKNRPALVLVVTEIDITVSFITTKIKWQEEFDISLNPTIENGLKKASLIRLNKIATVDKELVLGRLGNLTKFEIEITNKKLKQLLKLDEQK